MKHFVLAMGIALCATGFATAQTSELSVARIMQDPDTWVGALPGRPQWSESGEWLYFEWNPQSQFEADSLYKVSRDGGEPLKVSAAERRAVRPIFSGWDHGGGTYSADFGRKVFEDGGDVYVLNRKDGTLMQVTRTADRESSPRFMAGDTRILFQSDGNAYSLELGTGRIAQLTDLRSGRDRNREQKDDEQDAWLRAQQKDLFDVVREQIQSREAREAARERDQKAGENLHPHYYGEGRLQGLTVDPMGRYATFAVVEDRDSKRTLVQNYVTESGYAEDLNARGKVGAVPSDSRFFIQDLALGGVTEIKLSSLDGAYDVVPVHLLEEGVAVDSSKARALYASGIWWSPDGSHAVVQVLAADHKDRWLAILDPGTGVLSVLDRQTDQAWIDGPGIRGFGGGSLGWLPDNRTFWFQSEKSGYSHLYTVDVRTGTVRQLTDGPFEVTDVFPLRSGDGFLIETSQASPHERHLYRVDLKGAVGRALTVDVGQGSVAVHPAEDRAAFEYSTNTQPTEIYLQRFGRQAMRITHSTTVDWESYPWRTPELVQITASDGVNVPAHLFRPQNPNGGAVLFVHGAGYLQNVHNWWSSYFREYMFHNLLTDLGYTVLQLDYRASSGYGRDWRTAIYRYMGGRDLQDYVDASEYVRREFGIDPERVFIYGGSYGGFITLMALFTEPEHFGGGAALRSVTDWAHYNHGYTSNILNTPVNDSLAYARSSPINFAQGLEDPLLMPHGVIDTNVQYQDIIRLAQRLIELGKEDWELASYPVEGHGFTEPSSWTDEYRRILKLIEETVGPDRFR